MSAESAAAQPGPRNSLTDVPGIRVGHHTAVGDGYLTGTTVVLAPDGGMVAGVDVRGGGPATHETDLLQPTASVERIHALVLTGGSAYGLAACTGVMNALADRGIGLQVGPEPGEVVPLVPGAAVFDLGRGGDFRARPTAEFGALALQAAYDTDADQQDADQHGSVGAGTGAVTSNLKGGLGSASLVLPGGVTVAALAVVNAAGSPIDPRTGGLLGANLLLAADGEQPALPGDTGRAAAVGLHRTPAAADDLRRRCNRSGRCGRCRDHPQHHAGGGRDERHVDQGTVHQAGGGGAERDGQGPQPGAHHVRRGRHLRRLDDNRGGA